MNSRRIFFVLAVLSLTLFPLTLLPGVSFASERLFDFSGAGAEAALQGWEVGNVTAATMTQNGLRLRGANFVKINSPRGLRIPHGARIMEIRFELAESLYSRAVFRTSGGPTPREKSFKVKPAAGYVGGVVRYRLYVGDVTGRGEGINAFTLSFEAPAVDVTLASVRFYDPVLGLLIKVIAGGRHPRLRQVLRPRYFRPRRLFLEKVLGA